jgi:hypothetical protein
MILTISAIFEDPADVVQAITELQRAGIAHHQVEVISAEPHPGNQFLPSPRKSRIRAFALTGAFSGGLGGFLLSTLTALAYPLPTGGMPILSWWTIGIVIYEATMLGAIVATLLGLLVELKLPNFKPLPYDEAVADGGLLLVVSRCDGAQQAKVRQTFVAAVAKRIEEFNHQSN